MDRRAVLQWLLASCTPGWAVAQGKLYRLAWLTSMPVTGSAVWNELVTAMSERGWIEGKHYTLENLRYEGNRERLRAIAEEAVARKFDLIIGAGTPPSVAARQATAAIPIVFYFVGDPVGAGLVATFARPGGNATGLGGLGPGIYAKMLELLTEAAPRASRIAMLTNPDFALHADFAADAQSAARRLKVTLTPVEVRSPDDIEGAFSAMAAAKAEAVLILGQPFLIAHGARVAKLAMEQRLPTMVPFDGVVDEGILMSYGAKIEDDVRLVPRYIDRILKGANPADLPVEQPSRFYLTINLKTAKTIGVAMPASLRQRADRLVE